MRYGPNDGIPSGLGGWDSLANARAVGELSDSANAAEARNRAISEADDDTRAIRDGIKALAKRGRLFEEQVIAILSCVQGAVAQTGWQHLEHAVSADEYLSDAIHAMEARDE